MIANIFVLTGDIGSQGRGGGVRGRSGRRRIPRDDRGRSSRSGGVRDCRGATSSETGSAKRKREVTRTTEAWVIRRWHKPKSHISSDGAEGEYRTEVTSREESADEVSDLSSK